MRRTLIPLLALGALLAGLPANAQLLAGLSLSRSGGPGDTLRGGETTTLTINLNTNAPNGGMNVQLFSTIPQIIVPSSVTFPAGTSTMNVNITPLPIDTAVSGFIGVAIPGSTTMFTRLTVLNGPPYHFRIATFNPATRIWQLRADDGTSTSVTFGNAGDVPVPADYLEGAGNQEIAVFRPSTGDFVVRLNNGNSQTITGFGQAGDMPAPADYQRVGHTQFSVFRPGSQQWLIRTDTASTITVSVPFTASGDVPIPGDYLGLSRAQFAVYRPSTGAFLVRNDDGTATTFNVGQAGDIPEPGPYLGTNRFQAAVFRPSTGQWIIRPDAGGTAIAVTWGQSGDIPVARDYLANNRAMLAVFRPSTGQWIIRTDQGDAIMVPFGGSTDTPVPAVYAARFGT